MNYHILDKESIPAYLSQVPDIDSIISKDADIEIDEIGDGNLNYVYIVRERENPKNAIVLKQAVPYLRMVGEAWPLGRDRMTFEIRGLQQYNELVPELVPKIYHADEEMSVLIMEHLGEHIILRHGMIEGERYPKIGQDIGIFLAETLFRTSALGMDSIQRRELMDRFTLNGELCKLTEEFIFTFPIMEHDSNYSNPETDEFARNILRTDSEYKLRVLELKNLFLTKTDALLHADLHTGSLMVNGDETKIIDMEFAFFGPFGFDIGKIIANFLMSYTSHFYHSEDNSYQEWVLKEAMKVWTVFQARFLELWNLQGDSAMLLEGLLTEEELAEFQRRFMLDIFHDTIGFCACSLARRTVGIAGVPDIRNIEDQIVRSQLEITNLELSRTLMSRYKSIDSIAELEAVIREVYASRLSDLRS